MDEILNISADTEMASALQSAFDRGLGFDPESLRFWRDEDGGLVATESSLVLPGHRLVEIEYERGAGYRANQ